tara:strand:- start:136 stop:312 length:177 start_codon:yes stop_codon:yes gene_type:complete
MIALNVLLEDIRRLRQLHRLNIVLVDAQQVHILKKLVCLQRINVKEDVLLENILMRQV